MRVTGRSHTGGFLHDTSLMGNAILCLVATDAGALLELPISGSGDDEPHFSVALGGISSP